MRESRTYGSVRGAPSNGRPYRDRQRFQRRLCAIDLGRRLKAGSTMLSVTQCRRGPEHHRGRESPIGSIKIALHDPTGTEGLNTIQADTFGHSWRYF